MRKVFKVLGIILGIVILAIVGIAAFVNFKSFPNYNEEVPAPDLSVELTPERVNAGQALVHQNCAGCHKGPNAKFEGMLFEDKVALETFGTIYTPNITQDKEYGIGNYTDGQLYRLLRTGIKADGELMLPLMPRLTIAADEDIHAIIAYLRSDAAPVQASQKQHPPFQPTFLAKALTNFVFKPMPFKEEYPAKPALSDSIAYGRYLVNNSYGCYFCHSGGLDAWDLDNPPNTPGYLGGGTEFVFPEHVVVSPSLLMDGESDVSKWSVDQFVGAVKYGQRPNKPAYQLPMHPYNFLDSAEIRTIHQYLTDYSSK